MAKHQKPMWKREFHYISNKRKVLAGSSGFQFSFAGIKRGSLLQVIIWKRCGEINIQDVDPLSYGWQLDKIKNILMSIWFTGKQLRPSLCKSDRPIRKKVRDESGNSDLELSGTALLCQVRAKTLIICDVNSLVQLLNKFVGQADHDPCDHSKCST